MKSRGNIKRHVTWNTDLWSVIYTINAPCMLILTSAQCLFDWNRQTDYSLVRWHCGKYAAFLPLIIFLILKRTIEKH